MQSHAAVLLYWTIDLLACWFIHLLVYIIFHSMLLRLVTIHCLYIFSFYAKPRRYIFIHTNLLLRIFPAIFQNLWYNKSYETLDVSLRGKHI